MIYNTNLSLLTRNRYAEWCYSYFPGQEQIMRKCPTMCIADQILTIYANVMLFLKKISWRLKLSWPITESTDAVCTEEASVDHNETSFFFLPIYTYWGKYTFMQKKTQGVNCFPRTLSKRLKLISEHYWWICMCTWIIWMWCNVTTMNCHMVAYWHIHILYATRWWYALKK